MTLRVLPLFCLWDLAAAVDAAPPGQAGQDQRPYCIRMEVRLEGHAGGPPPAYSWNDAVVADVVCQINSSQTLQSLHNGTQICIPVFWKANN